jgi:hypothetical protein
MLLIDEITATRYLSKLGLEKFDKSVSKLLMDSDVAISIPGMGSIYLEQLNSLSKSLGLESNMAEERTIYIAGAAFMSMLNNAVDASRNRQIEMIDKLLRKSFSMLKHPLLETLTV